MNNNKINNPLDNAIRKAKDANLRLEIENYIEDFLVNYNGKPFNKNGRITKKLNDYLYGLYPYEKLKNIFSKYGFKYTAMDNNIFNIHKGYTDNDIKVGINGVLKYEFDNYSYCSYKEFHLFHILIDINENGFSKSEYSYNRKFYNIDNVKSDSNKVLIALNNLKKAIKENDNSLIDIEHYI